MCFVILKHLFRDPPFCRTPVISTILTFLLSPFSTYIAWKDGWRLPDVFRGYGTRALVKNWLTHFSLMFHFYIPRKSQKIFDFLMFSEGMGMEYWVKVGKLRPNKSSRSVLRTWSNIYYGAFLHKQFEMKRLTIFAKSSIIVIWQVLNNQTFDIYFHEIN